MGDKLSFTDRLKYNGAAGLLAIFIGVIEDGYSIPFMLGMVVLTVLLVEALRYYQIQSAD